MNFTKASFTAQVLFVIAGILLAGSLPTNAQVRPIYDQGAVGLGQMLKRIGNNKRIMHIGAHPDDEDSDLVAYLARKENARVVYLSLTRGDGGQNVIGPELFEALGIIRTEELLQARTLDGAEQMFTRAFDYGYSKTLAEAKAFWDEEAIKCDVVRAIRSFRPQVVNPRFSGTPADGHGQHQFAGYIAPIAVKAAADPNECPDAGPPWKVSKLYIGQSFRSSAQPSLRMNTGLYDPLIGKSYYEIAAFGRSQHKSQEQGGLELRGDRYSGVNLIDSSVEVPEPESSMFDGIDTSFSRLVPGTVLDALEADYQKGLEELPLSDPGKAVELLLKTRSELMKATSAVRQAGGTNHVREAVGAKIAEIDEAIRRASGIQIDFIAESDTVVKSKSFEAAVRVFYPENSGVSVKEIKLDAPDWWLWSEKGASAVEASSGRFAESPADSKTYSIFVPDTEELTQPYFLRKPKEGYVYQWEKDGSRNLPFQPALVIANVTLDVMGQEITLAQPIQYRFAHDTRGELRRDVHVVPDVSVDIDQHLLVIPQGSAAESRQVSINVTGHSPDALAGSVALAVPNGWVADCPKSAFEGLKKGESTSVECDVRVPANPRAGSYSLNAEVYVGGKTFTKTMNTIEYEHIQTHRYYTDATAKVVVTDLKTAPVKVGYVMGSGDSGPEALRQMGLKVELLDRKALTSGDLSVYDTIVIGIRASETNPDYIANNGRLLEYVNDGGTMIVQYQKFPYQTLNLAPYPVRYNARVADENAKITILEPGHPVFNYPNKITDSDFLGWVQERNLYSFRGFDERYTPLLESHDTGEEENKGGMVYTNVGKGKYMYVSYAFFRQLPAGVPGAYRLFANIVSLGERK